MLFLYLFVKHKIVWKIFLYVLRIFYFFPLGIELKVGGRCMLRACIYIQSGVGG